VLSPTDEAAVVAALEVMANKMARERLEIKPTFEDFDVANQGCISSTQFNRVLSIYNLLPSSTRMAELLNIKFSEPRQRGGGTHIKTSLCSVDVNYRAFLHAVELVRRQKNLIHVPGTRESK
jgi:hypothetical protein